MISDTIWDIAAFGIACALALYLTPLVRTAAVRFGVLDRPDGALKRQREPVPYLGGMVVYLAFLLSLSMVFDFDTQLTGLLLGGTLMAMLGLFDDLRVLPAHLKLCGQLLGAWVTIKCNIYIKLMYLPSWLALGLTVVWLVGITNAVNLIDVSDGLATSVGLVAALALGGVAIANEHPAMAITTFALAGALAGFLPINRAPARMYLGDTGSLFIGYMLAATSMIGAYTERSTWGFFAPVCVLCVPILETILVSAARLRQGRSPLHGSPDHFAIRLKHHGWSTRTVASSAAALTGVGSGLGLLLVLLPAESGQWCAAGAVALALTLLTWLWQKSPPSAGGAQYSQEPLFVGNHATEGHKK